MKRALICGRGKSLQHYKNLKTEDFDFVYLVNEFNKFIIEAPDLLSFLQECSKNAKIIQQVNIELAGMDKTLLDNLRIDECHVARLGYVPTSNSKWRSYVDTQRFIRAGIPIEIKPQPDCLEKYLDMDIVKGSLAVAIVNAAGHLNCDEITIIGSDFYEEDYFLSHRGFDWHLVSTEKTQNSLKKSLNDVCSVFEKVSFNVHTYSKFKSELPNCNVENL